MTYLKENGDNVWNRGWMLWSVCSDTWKLYLDMGAHSSEW